MAAFRTTLTQTARCGARMQQQSAAQPALRRAYASGPAASGSSSNTPLFLALGGVGGLGLWYALGGFGPADKEKAKQAAQQAVSAASKQVKEAALTKDGFVDFVLKEVKPYNHDSSTFVFELPEGKSSGLTTCSAVVVKAAGEGLKDDKGKPIIRPYTPTTSPETEGHMDFLVKKYDQGNMSKHIHSLKPGDKLSIKGPIDKFQFDRPNIFQEIGLIAGGTGITPHWQAIQKLLSDPAEKTKVTLIYANKTQADILLREEFDRLAKEKPDRFKVVYGTDGDEPPAGGFKGYITNEILRANLPLPGLADKAGVFVCGPPPFMEVISGNKGPKGSQGDLKGILADLGYAPSQVYKF
ncbi:NADH-cytochrome b5 reductase [Tilletia horrida]|nr:NADH-cytochrome b5 reductase [Tilletia horrida]